MKRGTLSAVAVLAMALASSRSIIAELVPEGRDAKFRFRYEEAQSAVFDGNYQLTELKVTVALAMRPEPKVASTLYQWRGWAYYHMGDIPRALAEYNSAIRLDPTIVDNYRSRAWLNYLLGHFAEAVSDYTHTLGANEPGRWDIYKDRGDAYAKLGRRDLARRDYEKAVLRPTKSAADFVVRANLFRQLGQLERAAADFATAKRMRPTDPQVLNDAAWFEATAPSAKFRDGRAALRDATLACERSKWRDADYLDTLAAAEAETGDFRSAIAHDKQAVALESDLSRRKALQKNLALIEKGKPIREDPSDKFGGE